MTDPILYLLAAVALLAAPGPTNTLLATAGAVRGFGGSLRLIAAALAAYAMAIAAYRLALGPVIAAVPAAGAVLKIAVALYVAWLAVRMWRSATSIAAKPPGARDVFVATLLNPKGFVAALTLLPAGPVAFPYFAGFATVVVVASAGWVMVGRGIAASLGDRHEHVIPRIAAVALGGFAGVIAASVLG
jgi:threonine/homoserine/homoserine lactone efflux protein